MSAVPTARESQAKARAAVWADADPLSEMLARAFFDDPLIAFLVLASPDQLAKMGRLFRILLKLALPFGGCDVTTGYEAAALWRPPGHWKIPFWQYIINGPEFRSVFGRAGVVRALKTMKFIEKRHPHEPHWYLQVIGTDPDKQGKGYGGVVIRRQLATADAAGMPAYLESSKESNIPIYQNFGFAVTGELNIPGGPTIWPMWRPARTAVGGATPI